MPIVRIPYNARISSTTLAGVPVYTNRRALIEDSLVGEATDVVEVHPDASSADMPLLHKVLYDRTGSCATAGRPGWARGDSVRLLSFPGAGAPITYPFHVLRAYEVPQPNPLCKVALARADVLYQTATWLQRITLAMPNVTKTAAFDPQRSQIVASSDGTWGVGLQRVVRGVTYNGYLPGISVQIGLNEYAEVTQITAYGVADYSHPAILYESGLTGAPFFKGDIIILNPVTDGRRLVVEDLVHRVQRNTVDLGVIRLTEARQPGDISYLIPAS